MSDRGPKIPTAEWFADGIVEERKLNDYLLSPTHPVGKHKLRLWRSVFGVGDGDGELLEKLIREQLVQATPQERSVRMIGNPHFVVREWELIIPRFCGPNGNENPVVTGWAFDDSNDRPHLTTAFPIV